MIRQFKSAKICEVRTGWQEKRIEMEFQKASEYDYTKIAKLTITEATDVDISVYQEKQRYIFLLVIVRVIIFLSYSECIME